MRTNVYIDGFNFYYGAVKGTPYKWLDLEALCRRLLPASDDLNRIRYFTAMVQYDARDPGLTQRQELYVRALKTIPMLTVHLGYFLRKPTRMALAKPLPFGPRTTEVIKTEEKGSDVNLGAWLLLDAHNGDFEQAIVVSNDSDLATPLWMVKKHFGLWAGVWNPHTQATKDREFAKHPIPGGHPGKAHPSVELRKVARFQREISSDGAASDVAACQFPDEMKDAAGVFKRPAAWS